MAGISNIFFIIFATTILLCLAQRPFYAGLRPIGYPVISEPYDISNRFGYKKPLPLEAKGDGALVNRLNNLPLDNRPFWYINHIQYDNLRRNTRTWPLKQNNFIE